MVLIAPVIAALGNGAHHRLPCDPPGAMHLQAIGIFERRHGLVERCQHQAGIAGAMDPHVMVLHLQAKYRGGWRTEQTESRGRRFAGGGFESYGCLGSWRVWVRRAGLSPCVGSQTLFQHVRAIGQSKESQDLMDGTK